MFIRKASKRFNIILFLLILLLGFVVRFYHLGTVPAGLQFDEAQSGYNGFLLLNYGRNMSGDVWPLNIDYFGDYRPAFSSYLTALSISVFNLNIFSTRVPVASFSVMLIILTYIFTKLCFQNKRVSFLASLLISVSPFAIIFSRSSGDVIIDICFEIMGIVCLIMFIKSRKLRFLVVTYISWLLGYYTYQTSRFFTPIFATITVFVCYLQYRPSWKTIFLAVLPLIIYLAFPFATYLRTPFGSGRFNQVSVFSFPEVQRLITEETFEHGVNDSVILTRILHNKPIDYAFDIIERYSIFFSPQTILFSITYPSFYFIPKVGAVTFLEYLGFTIALGAYFFRHKKVISLLPLIFLLISPIPSALTFEGTPHFLRAAFMILFWPIIAAYGLIWLINLIKNKIAICFIVLFFLFNSFYVFHQYYIHQPKHLNSIIDRRTEMESLALFLGTFHSSRVKIWISEYNNSYIYYYFFNKISVFDTKVNKLGKYFTKNFQIDNIYFSQNPCLSGKDLLAEDFDYVIIRNECPRPVSATMVKEFSRSDTSVASRAYKLDKNKYSVLKNIYLDAKSVDEKKAAIDTLDKTFIEN